MGGTVGLYTKLEVVWRTLIGITILSALVFALGIGCYWLFTIVVIDIPPAQGQVLFKDLFKDVLQTVLAIAAIGIAAFGAAFGFGIYKLLSRQIEEKVVQTNEKNLNITFARLKIDTGLLYWNLYRLSQGQQKLGRLGFLEKAIEETKEAYERAITTLDDRELRVERIMMSVKNNWAFYIYEQDSNFGPVASADKEIALECLRYINARKTKFSDITVQTLDTIEKVAGQFEPATP